MFIENKGAVKAALEAAGINLPETFNVDPGVVHKVEDEKQAAGTDPEAAHLLGIVEASRHVEAGIAERQANAAKEAAANAPVAQADGAGEVADEQEDDEQEAEEPVVQ